jgi:hypothetical protein
MRDGLFDIIFEEMKVLFLKPKDVAIRRAGDRHGNQDQCGVSAERGGGLRSGGLRIGLPERTPRKRPKVPAQPLDLF